MLLSAGGGDLGIVLGSVVSRAAGMRIDNRTYIVC